MTQISLLYTKSSWSCVWIPELPGLKKVKKRWSNLTLVYSVILYHGYIIKLFFMTNTMYVMRFFYCNMNNWLLNTWQKAYFNSELIVIIVESIIVCHAILGNCLFIVVWRTLYCREYTIRQIVPQLHCVEKIWFQLNIKKIVQTEHIMSRFSDMTSRSALLYILTLSLSKIQISHNLMFIIS